MIDLKISRNFLESLGWTVSAITHATESDDEFLHNLVDDLRFVYQLMAEDLKAQGVNLGFEEWCILKHNLAAYANDVEAFAKRKREGRSTEILKKLIDARGELIRKLVEHYEMGEEKRSPVRKRKSAA